MSQFPKFPCNNYNIRVEKEALIDINSKLHTRIEELEHEKKRIDARIWDLVTGVSELEITTRALDDQYEENNARIVKLEQTQKSLKKDENAEFTKIKDENNDLKKVINEFEIKKQAKCIQISKELLDEDPIVVYSIDGWSDPNNRNLYNFVLMTSDRREYLWKIEDFSSFSITGDFLAAEIEKSHLGMAALCESMEKLQIKGGGIKTFTKTRWSTVFDICETILRLRSAFEDIIREKPENLSSLCIRTINSHGFFDDIRQLTIVLQPIKNAIGILESKNATLADCFFNLCCLASAIYYIPAITNNTYQNFCNYCIDKFNERW
ncbi:21235_t:CDS:2, partial [Entrophospora sp. SA101]